MPDNFAVGETDDDNSAPPIETYGARYGINVKLPQTGRGEHNHLSEPYVMPSVQGRNGGYETFLPAAVIAPTDGLNPEFAINPAIPFGGVGTQMTPSGQPEAFGAGVADATF